MQRIARRVTAVLTLGFVCALPGLGQGDSGTLAETTAFLQTNLGGSACAAYVMGRSQAEMKQYTEGTEATFLDCEMTLETSSTVGDLGNLGGYRVHLGQLDPARITTIPGVLVPSGWLSFGDIPRTGIRLVTLKDEKLIDARSEPQGNAQEKTSTFKVSEINIHVRDAEAADKLKRAFSRAITLCGGKSTP